MAALYLSIYDTRYEASEPLYLTTMRGEFVWDRVRGRWLDWASLEAKQIEESHTWQPREVGIPSILWQLSNSHVNGQDWAPGLDDTSGLASEAVLNGDDWLGADTGSATTTPPTSWTLSPGTCQNFSGTLNVYGDPVLGASLEQTITVTPGEYYVLEILVEQDTTGDARVSLDGISLPIGPGRPDGSSQVRAMSFLAPADGNVDLAISTAGGGVASIGHIRVFLESELTGNPGGSGSGGVGPITPIEPDPIKGPYSADDVSYWINTDNCKIGFNLDADAEADLWMTGKQLCRRASISDDAKMGISAQLEAEGCEPLPCIANPEPVTQESDYSDK